MNSAELDLARLDLEFPPCLGCGCNDGDSCPDGCFWVEPEICSNCVPIAAPPAHLQGVPVRRLA